MPPRSSIGAPAARTARPQSTVQTVVNAALAPENRPVVTALGMFVAGVAFLHTGFGEFLLPPTV